MSYRFPELIYLGIFLSIIWAIGYYKFFKKPQLIIPKRFIRKKRGFFRFIAFLLGVVSWIFITLAMMGPRMPIAGVENEIDVIDIFFVVDISNSMRAIDFKPNRLEVAKLKIKEFVTKRKEDRIGIIVFAENAFTLLPLTTDMGLVSNMIDKIGEFNLSSGTNIGDAIGLAVARASMSLAKNKVAILLTDGVNNVGNMTPHEAANEAKNKKLRIYTIGIGGKKGALIPQRNTITGKTSYIPLPGGSIDLKTLNEIAEISGGKQFYAQSEDTLKKIFNSIDRIEKSKVKTYGKILYKEKYISYLIIGLILLILSELTRRYIVREGF